MINKQQLDWVCAGLLEQWLRFKTISNPSTSLRRNFHQGIHGSTVELAHMLGYDPSIIYNPPTREQLRRVGVLNIHTAVWHLHRLNTHTQVYPQDMEPLFLCACYIARTIKRGT